MIKNKINSYADLIQERERLKEEIAHYEFRIREDIMLIEESFKPGHLAADFAKRMVTPSNENLVTEGVKTVVGSLATKLFSSYAWPVRFVLTQLSKSVATKYVKEKGPTVANSILHLLKKKRETEKAPVLETL